MTRTALPGDPEDTQSRYIEAAVNGVLIASLYAPNGNPQPGPKFDYKLAWLERLARHARSLLQVRRAGRAGRRLQRGADAVRHLSDEILGQRCAGAAGKPRGVCAGSSKQGWTDAIRERHPDEPMYTFWHYMRNRWERDAGLRLDHLLLSEAAARRLKGAGVDRAVRGKPNASDHAPAWIELRPAGRSRRS